MLIDFVILYLSLVFAFRLGAFLAVYTDIRVWQLCLIVIVFKFFIMSYGYK